MCAAACILCRRQERDVSCGMATERSLFAGFFVSFLLLFSCTAAAAVVAGNVSWNDDVLGLLVFKADLHDPKSALSSWNEEDVAPCSWKGVKCSSSSGRVESLSLDGLQLSGQIGRGLLKLDHLRALSLSHNNLSGTVIPELAVLLESLDLSHNQLFGAIPDSIGSSTNYLDLSDNAFAGPIPSGFFSQCGSLVHLSLARNALQGPIPDSIASCEQLLVLDVSGNELEGDIPSGGISALARLKVLDLSRNQLSGGVPSELERLKSLTDLSLESNHLSGKLPEELGSCSSLKYLDLSNNALDGEIPMQMQNLGSLVVLRLGGNKFTGELPEWIGSHLGDLEELSLSWNSFEGSIPASLGSLASLCVLDMAGNMLQGGIPQSFLQLLRLSSLDMSSNGLTGSIPSGLFSISLQFVNLSRNSFTERLPLSPPCRSLQVLDVSRNQIADTIPSTISQCSRLHHINLASNLFVQEIPAGISELRLLTFLDVSGNQLGESIPRSITNMTSLTVLKLQKNMLAGSIPSELCKCEHLRELDLSVNRLNGSIPSDLAKLKELRYLDLSWNNFSGAIPRELVKLQSLSKFNVSHNHLDGPIPNGGVFNLMNGTSFQGNAGLCGSAVNVACAMVPKPIVLNPNGSSGQAGIIQSGGHRGRNKIVLSVSAIIAISAAAVIALGIVVVSVLNIRAQAAPPKSNFLVMDNSSPSSPSEDFAIGKLVMFTDGADTRSEELLPSAHALLNKEREIGRGGFGVVYMAALEDGRMFAVKKLLMAGLVKAQVEFEKEVQQLGKIQHPNLVALQGYYWTSRMQLLIYDFVPNGNLYSRLHEQTFGEAPLSWSDRFGIALGTAHGLSHLHHGCQPQVIHYDLKSSNILLTADNRPQISDYGLANLFPMHTISSKFQSALGYTAPEFACQSLKVNEKCDVYGFGVILLELVTGRRPVEYMEDDVVVLCDYVRALLEEGRALSCVDSGLESCPEDEVLPVIKLGLICTSQIPSNRPSMAEVVQILELVKPIRDASDSL